MKDLLKAFQLLLITSFFHAAAISTYICRNEVRLPSFVRPVFQAINVSWTIVEVTTHSVRLETADLGVPGKLYRRVSKVNALLAFEISGLRGAYFWRGAYF